MSNYVIEVDKELEMWISNMAEKSGKSAEAFITEILNRYAALPHTIQTEEIKEGYAAMGDINLDWANLK